MINSWNYIFFERFDVGRFEINYFNLFFHFFKILEILVLLLIEFENKYLFKFVSDCYFLIFLGGGLEEIVKMSPILIVFERKKYFFDILLVGQICCWVLKI